MTNDFRNFAVHHLGMSGNTLDSYTKAINSVAPKSVMTPTSDYMNPYILEERQLNVTQMDVFSRLMMDRIIFLGTQSATRAPTSSRPSSFIWTLLIPTRTFPSISILPADLSTQASESTTRCSTFRLTCQPSAPAWRLQWQPFFS